MKQTVSQQI